MGFSKKLTQLFFKIKSYDELNKRKQQLEQLLEDWELIQLEIEELNS